MPGSKACRVSTELERCFASSTFLPTNEAAAGPLAKRRQWDTGAREKTYLYLLAVKRRARQGRL